jgi:hypothetical protein
VWQEAADAVDAWTHANAGASVLVLDPDSRITQLGLLPLIAPPGETRLFPARGMPVTDRRDLTALAEDWARRVTGGGAPALAGPRLIPPADDLRRGAELVTVLRRLDGRPVAVGSLGVGGNPRKAVDTGAEVAALVRVGRHASVVLDAGTTAEETARATAVATGVAAATDRRVSHVSAGSPYGAELTGGAALVVLHGADLCAVTGVLAHSDLFVGYDSAFQHIAAAVGTPGVVVFVDPPSTTFVDRWRAPGSTAVVVRRGAARRVENPTAAIERAVTGLLRRRLVDRAAGR